MPKEKVSATHPMVKQKIQAGLSQADAIEVTERQLAHDEELEAAEAALKAKTRGDSKAEKKAAEEKAAAEKKAADEKAAAEKAAATS
jgi:hypothetical protein